jgi:hypothetical protein
VHLFNPRRQAWTAHFDWSEDLLEIIGLTPTGRATVAKLRLNREKARIIRSLLLDFGHHPAFPA